MKAEDQEVPPSGTKSATGQFGDRILPSAGELPVCSLVSILIIVCDYARAQCENLTRRLYRHHCSLWLCFQLLQFSSISELMFHAVLCHFVFTVPAQ